MLIVKLFKIKTSRLSFVLYSIAIKRLVPYTYFIMILDSREATATQCEYHLEHSLLTLGV